MNGIVLQGVAFAVAGKPILHGISLDLQEQRIGIVGRNGSGKTTLLRLMAGLVAPTAGTVRLGGVDPAKDRRAALAAVGILFQNPDHQIIFPTVAEELAFGLVQQGLSRSEAAARVCAALEAEGRGDWAGQPVQALSQGQKQWLCLMAILLMAPGTILLDEPFAALDLPLQIRLTRRLAALPQRLVTISHDPAAVAGCDRVIWLEAGRVAMDGAATPVLAAFRAEMERIGGTDADADLAG
ncbi:biotin transport system ATP-binding protein [Gemmobacter aquatilis]|uniref:Biotin transport system ATP-binding protein n=1 Tax=Gemmobacter aquatilis TaxID=933059 RepID=A0A1H8EZM8_9RHOB|nr:ABC transporter ATP-binding protein [Gemmobacter aquatilis]SEN24846.1 biotin transport system ATP-binding protein [Gemmobacter aquatilis]